MDKLIKYVDTLEKANRIISDLEIPKEIDYYAKDIKDVTTRINCIIDIIDEKYHKEFYGIEE